MEFITNILRQLVIRIITRKICFYNDYWSITCMFDSCHPAHWRCLYSMMFVGGAAYWPVLIASHLVYNAVGLVSLVFAPESPTYCYTILRDTHRARQGTQRIHVIFSEDIYRFLPGFLKYFHFGLYMQYEYIYECSMLVQFTSHYFQSFGILISGNLLYTVQYWRSCALGHQRRASARSCNTCRRRWIASSRWGTGRCGRSYGSRVSAHCCCSW